MKTEMKSISLGVAARIMLLAGLAGGLAGCDTVPKLKAAEKYSADLKTSIAAVQAVVDDRADAVRIGKTALAISPVNAATLPLVPGFTALACEAYSLAPFKESVAIAELATYRSLISGLAEDTKDPSIAGDLANIQKSGALVFKEVDGRKIEDEMAKRETQCTDEVALLLSPAAGSSGKSIGLFLKIWPSIKGLLTYAADAADKQARIAALRRILSDPATARRIKTSMDVIRNSSALGDAILTRRRESLLVGFAHYVRVQSATDFLNRHKAATKMNIALGAYQRYADIDLGSMAQAMSESNQVFSELETSKSPKLGDVVSALDLFSGFAEKWADAKEKLDAAKAD
jgi:hypothetical protein